MSRPRPIPFHYWHEGVLALLLVGLFIGAYLLMPSFVELRSQMILSRHLWVLAIMGVGMTLIILTGGIDLSIGSAMGLCAVGFGLCFARTANLWASSVVCLGLGGLGGCLNGLLISRGRLHPLIVTLATYALFRGLAEGFSQGAAYSQFGDGFGMLARGTLFYVPIPAWIFLSLSIVVAFWVSATPAGRGLYAIGYNVQAARFSGIPVDRILLGLYTLSGLLAGLATLIYVSRFDTAKADVGTGSELDVITAVVVGGTSISGGRGTLVGTALGLLLIHELKMFVGRYWQIEEWKSILVGCLLIVSIVLVRIASRERINRADRADPSIRSGAPGEDAGEDARER